MRTKLLVPPLRRQHIARPHLIASLQAGRHRRLTLISAPAGFGKTTLAADWLSREDGPSVWLSLDEDDNDLVRFFTYLAAAMRQIEGVGHGLQRVLQRPQPAAPKALATALINDAAGAPAPFLLALDDYHLVDEPAVHEAVALLLEHGPPPLHLLIVSRTDPLLPLPRLRARGQLTELRAADLRFTPEEAAAFLRQVMGLDLTAEQVAALEGRTEGWIAGLQMAALSLQGLRREADVAAFVADFAGSHRYIFDYLTDEVLDQRPANTRAFLLHTSILDRFNAALCAVVTGQPDAEATLRSLERANLFLFALDEQRRWYRYHHLFADLLRRRLQQQAEPELIKTLHRRAGAWFAARGGVETAVRHALAGDDPALAARWLDEVALDYVSRSHLRELFALTGRLPLAAQTPHARLCLALAWSHVFNADLDAAETYLAHAAAALAGPDAHPAADFPPALAQAYLATIEAFVATRRARPAQAVARSREVLALLATLPEALALRLRGSVLINLGQALVVLNDVAEADAAYRQAIRDTKAIDRVFGVMAATANLMKLQHQCGHLAAARLSGRGALAWLAERRRGDEAAYPAEGEVRRELAVVCYELNLLDEARRHVAAGLDLYRGVSDISTSSCLHTLFKLELAAGRVAEAAGIHRQIETLMPGMATAFSYPLHDARRAERLRRLRLAQPGEPGWEAALRRWAVVARGNDGGAATNLGNADNAFLRACVAADLGDGATTLDVLDRLVAEARPAGRSGDLVRYQVRGALVLDQLGRRSEAIASLAEALRLAAATGHRRSFLDEGPALRPLLEQAPPTGWRDALLRELGGTPATAEAPSAAEPLLDPLSEREQEVLALLVTHLTGPEIAGRLHISRNTLKTHTRHIYDKLGAHSRTAAVARGRALGLLP